MGRAFEPRLNGQIRAPQVRLIDEKGEQLGVKNLAEAIEAAQTRGLDLIEIAPQSSPPVCKITDYSKFRYLREKKLKEARKRQHSGQLKEMRFGLKIGLHDFDVKLNAIQEFLKRHNKVRISILFRGREMEHKELGLGLISRIKERLSKLATVEQEPQMTGNRLIMILVPHH